jgi:hypothetical protein
MSWHLLAGVGVFVVAIAGTRFADRRDGGRNRREFGGEGRGRNAPNAQQPLSANQQGFRPAPTRRGYTPGGGAPRWFGPGPSYGMRGRGRADPARWAGRLDLGPLIVRTPVPGRVVIGTCGSRLIAAERGHSLLVVGPTQSGKTTGLAAPAIREWEGPVVAASVKGDLARLTIEARSQSGEVLVYDPLGTTGLVRAAWSPLGSCRTWTEARRVAADLAGVARDGASTMSDGDFWYSMAAKLLGPLFLAAAHNGIRMSEVLRWVDEADLSQALNLLTMAGEEQAVQALHATIGRDDRQRSAVFTTAETVIEAFADPDVAACESVGAAAPKSIDAAGLLDGNQTLYVCAPPHDQRRLRPLFATLGDSRGIPACDGIRTRARSAASRRLGRGGKRRSTYGARRACVDRRWARSPARYGLAGPGPTSRALRATCAECCEQSEGEALPHRDRRSGDSRARQPARGRRRPDCALEHNRRLRVPVDYRRSGSAPIDSTGRIASHAAGNRSASLRTPTSGAGEHAVGDQDPKDQNF